MRQEKFDNSKEAYDSDDIKYAFEYNGLASHLGEIDVIVAEVCGANDEDNWYWILQMKDGSFKWAEGGCDYTGWDCQSHASISDSFKTPQEAVEALPVSEYDSKPAGQVKRCLYGQLNDEVPFAIYDPSYVSKSQDNSLLQPYQLTFNIASVREMLRRYGRPETVRRLAGRQLQESFVEDMLNQMESKSQDDHLYVTGLSN